MVYSDSVCNNNMYVTYNLFLSIISMSSTALKPYIIFVMRCNYNEIGKVCHINTSITSLIAEVYNQEGL